MMSKYFSFGLPLLMLWFEFTRVLALYEDQIGKFDWKMEFVGPIAFSTFQKTSVNGDVLFVGSEHNVVASISLKTGRILWRKVLEKGSHGLIQHLNLVNNGLFVITGTVAIQLRGWNAKSGYLTHHWSFQDAASESIQTLWHIQDLYVYKITFTYSLQLKYSKYRLHNGDLIAEKSLSAPTNFGQNCAINIGILFCEKNGHTLSADVTAPEFNFKESVSQFPDERPIFVKSGGSPLPTFVLGTLKDRILFHADSSLEISILKRVSAPSSIFSVAVNGESSPVIITANSFSMYTLELEGTQSSQVVFKKRYVLKHPAGEIQISNGQCVRNRKGVVECKILLANSDSSLILLSDNGKVEWVREEALSSVVTAEMIELPMSDSEEAEMQTEFDVKESDIVTMFTKRVASHLYQLQKAVFGLSGIIEKSFSFDTNKDKVARDYFNLHKIILVVTKSMKIFAIDNQNKAILWSHLLGNELEPFPSATDVFGIRVPLFVQRSYRHFPHQIMCSILVRNKITKNGVIIPFNPIHGKFESPLRLEYKIKQAMLLPKETPDDFIHPLTLLDEDNTVHLFPEHAKSILNEIAPTTFFHVADAETCQVNGYAFESYPQNTTLVPTWNMQCSGKIVAMAAKNSIERVHSQGRVLPDRSVLYKYINPNLIVIVSQSINPEDQKSVLSLYFIDSVTGVVVNGDTRHRASGPVFLVHSENWVVLIYSNEKARRTEVVTYELHEGKMQHNSTAFSSIQTKTIRPIVDSRAYILPTSCVEAARETITEKGITSKHVLVALSSGHIIELPWVILDPRRPFVNSPETKEEGVIPYMPEIRVPTESMINYNQTLHRVNGIITSPSGLESTSLVFVHGLDLYYTRLSPSKTFDLLKEDFDYMLIIIVLALLVLLTVVTKNLAYRKALVQAWR